MSFVITLIQLVIWFLVIRGVYRTFKRAAKGDGKSAGSDKTRQASVVRTTRTISKSGKVTAGLNRASKAIYREERRLDAEDQAHAALPGQCKYSTQDPGFSFNGKPCVDEFAALRKANAVHEQHLRERIGSV